jgi:uncharacterized RDD family membrane protein YckC
VSAASRRARAEAVRGRRAGVATRYAAAGVDFLVAGGLLFGGLVGFAALHYLFGGSTFELPRAGAVFNAAAFPIVAFLYLVASWTTTGRTIGSALFGLRVVRDTGVRVGVLRASGRALICTTFGVLSLAWAAISTRNAAVHDLLLRTSVVHDWTAARTPAPASVVIPEGGPV